MYLFNASNAKLHLNAYIKNKQVAPYQNCFHDSQGKGTVPRSGPNFVYSIYV
jgi:hypothetical protein